MKRLAVLGGALLVALAMTGMLLPEVLAAQTPPETLKACEENRRSIKAAELPRTVEPGSCSFEGKIIKDAVVGSVVPDPGQSIYATAMTTTGAQELELTRLTDGTLELKHVGDEVKSGSSRNVVSTSDLKASTFYVASSPNACNDTAYNVSTYTKWYERLNWYFNRSTTPGELTRNQATSAVRQAGANITSARNDCGMGDGVSATIGYQGNTSRRADIDAGANCTRRDGTNVVSFGDLPATSTRTILGANCNWSVTVARAPAEIVESDIKVNKVDANWTTAAKSPSCSGYTFGLEALVTHERGHSFGLSHVSEDSHKYLTMSPTLAGPCRSYEHTLGRGDIYGLRQRY